jgi:hypothetical protein
MSDTIVDVRPILSSGGEPLSEILAAADSVANGDRLVVIAPFEPVPLFGILRGMGFRYASEPEPGGGVRVVFTRTPLS